MLALYLAMVSTALLFGVLLSLDSEVKTRISPSTGRDGPLVVTGIVLAFACLLLGADILVHPMLALASGPAVAFALGHVAAVERWIERRVDAELARLSRHLEAARDLRRSASDVVSADRAGMPGQGA